MSPARDKGAAPAVEMAELNSDLHHLRDQTDRDRRAISERLIELRGWRERVEGLLGDLGINVTRLQDSNARLERDGVAQTKVLHQLTGVMLEQRGALRLIKWLVPAGVAADVAFRIWGHR